MSACLLLGEVAYTLPVEGVAARGVYVFAVDEITELFHTVFLSQRRNYWARRGSRTWQAHPGRGALEQGA
jgi:hypothetical protein